MTPRWSVVVPLHNAAGTVHAAVESVLAQRERNLEVIVVDDGSTDGGAREVEAIGDPRVRLVAQDRGGVSAARNRGLGESRAPWVAFLDADDLWLPGFLEEVDGLRERFPTAAVCATRYFLESRDGSRRTAAVPSLPAGYRGLLPDYPSLLLAGDPPFHVDSAAVRREALASVGGFAAGAPAGEDLVTFWKLTALHALAWSSEPCAVYRAPAPGERGVRTPPGADPVEDEVRRFLSAHADVPRRHADRFLAYWFRVRAVTFLAAGMPREARRFAAKSIVLVPAPRVIALWLLGRLPGTLGAGVLRGARRALAALRGGGR